MMKISLGIFLLVSGMGLTACTASAQRGDGEQAEAIPMVAELLYGSAQCGYLDDMARVSLIDTVPQLEAAYRGFQKHVMGAAPVTLPAVDFKREWVVLLEMGRRPTLGYRLALNSMAPQIINRHLEVVVDWIEPGRNMAVGEMLTSPCLLLKLPKGPYQTVLFKDQNGMRKAILDIPQ